MKKHHEFGQFLLANSYIDAKELAGGLKVALESGEPIGEVLVGMGVLPVSYTHLTLPTNREV